MKPMAHRDGPEPLWSVLVNGLQLLILVGLVIAICAR